MNIGDLEELAERELYIEELGQVSGGMLQYRHPITTLALGEEGTHVPALPWLPKPTPPKGPPGGVHLTTLALGEEGSGPSVHILPLVDD